MGAQSSSQESLLSPKEDQGFPWALINLVSAPALGLGTTGEADGKRTLVFLAPTSKGCNVENPFLLIFCQLLGPTTCNLLPLLLLAALTEVPIGCRDPACPCPAVGSLQGKGSIFITRASPEPAMRSAEPPIKAVPPPSQDRESAMRLPAAWLQPGEDDGLPVPSPLGYVWGKP